MSERHKNMVPMPLKLMNPRIDILNQVLQHFAIESTNRYPKKHAPKSNESKNRYPKRGKKPT